MPFSDPEAKRRWQKAYNRRYYAANKASKNLVRRAVDQKRDLRTRKRRWILDRLDDRCSTCGEISMALELTRIEGRAVVDHSWNDLRALAHTVVATCGACRSQH
jgi:hypothetical protein